MVLRLDVTPPKPHGIGATQPERLRFTRARLCVQCYLPDNTAMPARKIQQLILITGANGQIGSEVCRALRADHHPILAVDVDPDPAAGVVACDLREKAEIERLFQANSIGAVIHLAAVLPTAFRADPVSGAQVNLIGACELLRQSVQSHVKRFVFASSMSVYGLAPRPRPCSETDPATPEDPYGGSKRAVELVGEALVRTGAIEFVALRIARVIGPGARKTSSPWRSQILDPPPGLTSISIPFAPHANLSLVHVEDVARMLITLVQAPKLARTVYNTPAEQWEAARLKTVIEESIGIRIELGAEGAHAGPACDGACFAHEFGFQLRPLRDRLARRASKS